MNRIFIDKEEVILEKVAKSITINSIPRNNPFSFLNVTIDIVKSCDLELVFNLEDSKINILINCNPNIKFNLYEVKKGCKSKIQYKFDIKENSNVCVEKLICSSDIKESTIIQLNGESASIDYKLKSIADNKQVYDIAVSHNCKNTSSNITNNSVCIDDGKVFFQVFGYVDNGINKCILNHDNHIINLTNNKCQICPNFYISECDTIVNHSAIIDGLKEEKLSDSKKIINDFLLNNVNSKIIQKEIKNNVNKYWR